MVVGMARHTHLHLVTDPDGARSAPHLKGEGLLIIDCDACVAQFSDACDDCVVSYLVNHEPGTPVLLDDEERRAVALLADAGLVPPSRFRSRHGVA